VINPEMHIATLTDKKAELEMEIEINSGLGFMPVETRKKEKLEIGVIAIDALFSPIRKVNFEVENMRVGDRTDFNRLKIEIETDGSVTPQDGFKKAGEILVSQFETLIKEGGESGDMEEKDSVASEGEGDEVGKTKVEDLKLSTRTVNSLIEGGIRTVGGLAKKSEDSLRELDGMGDKGITEIKKVLKKLGLGIKEE
jgi:DNA-directed RNA polymerase subunit alpha